MSDSKRIFADISELSRGFGAVSFRQLHSSLQLAVSPAKYSQPTTPPPMPENTFLIALLQAAESWAARARSSLVHLHTWDRSHLVAGRRPEERALLAAALDVVDLVRAQPGGEALLLELGVGVANPPSSALAPKDSLVDRFNRVRSQEFSPRLGDSA